MDISCPGTDSRASDGRTCPPRRAVPAPAGTRSVPAAPASTASPAPSGPAPPGPALSPVAGETRPSSRSPPRAACCRPFRGSGRSHAQAGPGAARGRDHRPAGRMSGPNCGRSATPDRTAGAWPGRRKSPAGREPQRLNFPPGSPIRRPRPDRVRRRGTVCPGGGIGRRAGFRCQWPQGRGSSSLLLGTMPSPGPARSRRTAPTDRMAGVGCAVPAFSC